MEGLAPPLKLVLEVRKSLERGDSLRTGVQEYLRIQRGEFPAQVMRWLRFRDENRLEELQAQRRSIRSPYRQGLLRLLESGLAGQTIYPRLIELQGEIEEACRTEVERKLEVLPFVALIPLLFFQVPALLILVFVPLLQRLMEDLNR